MKRSLIVLYCLLVLSVVSGKAVPTYLVKAERVNNLQPVISSLLHNDGSSRFTYNYNPSYIPLFDSNGQLVDGLLVRSQNVSDTPNVGFLGPSFVTLARSHGFSNLTNIQFEEITNASVVLGPSTPLDAMATEDPRVVYDNRTGTYYLLYSAVRKLSNGDVRSALALATSKDAIHWTKHGALFPNLSWSKSGALLIREQDPSYLLWGDSSLVPGIHVAITEDLLHYKNLPNLLMKVRNDSFDSLLIESGPMPLPLSDGNYLFIYNSARSGYPSQKPNWDLQYNVGWAILDKHDPSRVISRCNEPLLSPSLSWETGTSGLDLTPNVVFLEGWKPLGNDRFLGFYGGADSVVGTCVITVTIQP